MVDNILQFMPYYDIGEYYMLLAIKHNRPNLFSYFNEKNPKLIDSLMNGRYITSLEYTFLKNNNYIDKQSDEKIFEESIKRYDLSLFRAIILSVDNIDNLFDKMFLYDVGYQGKIMSNMRKDLLYYLLIYSEQNPNLEELLISKYNKKWTKNNLLFDVMTKILCNKYFELYKTVSKVTNSGSNANIKKCNNIIDYKKKMLSNTKYFDLLFFHKI
ncbi:hypothetical protein Catovirus_1_427 [Catovirus CTV1]|uniref:Uncharacterized protein n=1 Tax=Catovirus CTV1 TaxID=1977631 RepID=A0A1V0S9I3_9VIRU|nr:hypothetical protein Catovirus_1_427 [Catovirus CTV1]